MHISGIISIILLHEFLLQPPFAFRRFDNPCVGVEKKSNRVEGKIHPGISLALQCSRLKFVLTYNSLLLILRFTGIHKLNGKVLNGVFFKDFTNCISGTDNIQMAELLLMVNYWEGENISWPI